MKDTRDFHATFVAVLDCAFGPGPLQTLASGNPPSLRP
jgi:hypothetical protein